MRGILMINPKTEGQQMAGVNNTKMPQILQAIGNSKQIQWSKLLLGLPNHRLDYLQFARMRLRKVVLG